MGEGLKLVFWNLTSWNTTSLNTQIGHSFLCCSKSIAPEHDSGPSAVSTRRWNIDTSSPSKDCVDSLRGSFVKIGTIQRRLAWPLRKDDTHKSRSANSFLPQRIVPTLPSRFLSGKKMVDGTAAEEPMVIWSQRGRTPPQKKIPQTYI